MKRILSVSILVSFLITSQVGICPLYAQDLVLPAPGSMVYLSPPLNPLILKGIKVHPDNPFQFDFILNKGDSSLSNKQLKEQSSTLIKYFLASLTIPEKDLWVNLSPYEKDRIIPGSFGLTTMGRDLLAEDYMLKQITASLIYPESATGKKFWKRIYQESAQRYGTTNIPVNTFNKVWIVPQKAVVFENAQVGTAYIVESRLKVMLDQDYLSLQKHNTTVSTTLPNDTHSIGANIVREIVIPELTREVNEDKNFAQLRQVYSSVILATWYKKKIRDSILSQVYSDKNKVAGVTTNDLLEKGKIYQRYLQAFKKGVFNYVKEEKIPNCVDASAGCQPLVRKYFSGGITALATRVSIQEVSLVQLQSVISGSPDSLLETVDISPAMLTPNDPFFPLKILSTLVAIAAIFIPTIGSIAKSYSLNSSALKFERTLSNPLARREEVIDALTTMPSIDWRENLFHRLQSVVQRKVLDPDVSIRETALQTYALLARNEEGIKIEDEDALNIVHMNKLRSDIETVLENKDSRVQDIFSALKKIYMLDINKTFNIGRLAGDLNGLIHHENIFVRMNASKALAFLENREDEDGRMGQVDRKAQKKFLAKSNGSSRSIGAVQEDNKAAFEIQMDAFNIYEMNEFRDDIGKILEDPLSSPKDIITALSDIGKLDNEKAFNLGRLTNDVTAMTKHHDPDVRLHAYSALTRLEGYDTPVRERYLMEDHDAYVQQEGLKLLMSYYAGRVSRGGLIDLHAAREVERLRKTLDWTQWDKGQMLVNAAMSPAKSTSRPLHHVATLPQHNELGGIDLTPANMNLRMQNGGGVIKFHMNSAMLAQLQNAPGFVPVIINIQPLTNLQQFLGIKVSTLGAAQ